MSAPTVALIIMERSEKLSHQRLHHLVGSSLPQLARFRSRLVNKPLGLGQATWAEIDDYDPTQQIHSATVRAPGGRDELAELIAQLTTRPPDPREPLWEAWSIDGLAGGRWALAVKMSPALSDAAGSVWPRLLTTRSRGGPIDDLPTEPSLGTPPSLSDLFTGVITEILELQVTGVLLVAEAVTGVLHTVRLRLSSEDQPDPIPPAASSMSGPVPHTAFDAPLSQRRTVAFASIPLAHLKTVNKAFGGSIANVFLAACTLSLRAWLQRHDAVPDDPLLIQMPLSLPPADPATIGNPSTVGRIRLPVQLDDPVQVLTNLHTATERLNTTRQRNAEKIGLTVDFETIAALIPPAVAHAGMRLFTGLGLWKRTTPICHGSVSHIAAKPVPAYCAGAKVVEMHTVAPPTDGGLNITLTSRGDVMDLSVCVCPDNVPAVNEIATGIAESVGILVAAAQESPRGHGRSVVTEMTSHITKRSQA